MTMETATEFGWYRCPSCNEKTPAADDSGDRPVCANCEAASLEITEGDGGPELPGDQEDQQPPADDDDDADQEDQQPPADDDDDADQDPPAEDLSKECPLPRGCGAGIDERCHTQSGNPTTPHAARTAA